MVSLEKKPVIREECIGDKTEITPVHLMDKEETARMFGPRREERIGDKGINLFMWVCVIGLIIGYILGISFWLLG